ncbi:hypothetical protein DR950_20265 [Kitasatospora xanthocidica]|uniref:Uncharacterized protein n=1 Tax=Kitasatospora xanthocidica TaxID=83382 RepID=A0A372ZWB9_9ACTN|nr:MULTISPECIES: hypothetical protein [Kitasatospora]RGD59804.1 hypothetical protein DR950_20265 [Kitasatospora xanthocidica]
MLLPDVASQTVLIEVVRIADPRSAYGSDSVTGEVLTVWDSEHLRQALDLMGELPEGELRRCFAPGYGIRAHGPGGLLFEVSFCFSCHGVWLAGPGVPSDLHGMQAFDADSPPARELLHRFRTSAGNPA